MVYDAAFNEPNSPWFQMFSQAVYKGDIAGALKTGQSGSRARGLREELTARRLMMPQPQVETGPRRGGWR